MNYTQSLRERLESLEKKFRCLQCNAAGNVGAVYTMTDNLTLDNTILFYENAVLQNTFNFSNYPTYADLFTGNAILEGGVSYNALLGQWYVWSTRYIIDGVFYNTPVDGYVTLPTGDPLFDRVVLFKITNDGAGTDGVGFDLGPADGTLLEPSLDLTQEVEVAFRILGANETVPPEVTDVLVYDENVGEPTEWTIDTAVVGGDPADVADFFNGTLSYDIPASTGTTLSLFFDTVTPIGIGVNTNLIFAFKTDASWANNGRFRAYIQLAGVETSSLLSWNRNQITSINFVHTTTGTWQIVQIPLSLFGFGQATFDGIGFEFENLPNLQFDRFYIQNGIELNVDPASANYTLEMTDTHTASLLNNTVSAGDITLGAIIPIDEGNGIGFVRRDSDRALTSNVGLNAFDFGYYFGDATQGASGQASVNFGGDNKLSNTFSFAHGYNNTLTGYGSMAKGNDNIINSTYGTAFGTTNTIYSGAYAGHVVGGQNVLGITNNASYSGVFGVAYGYNTRVDHYANMGFGVNLRLYGDTISGSGYSAAFGINHNLDIVGGFAAGIALEGQGVGCFILGQANVDFATSTNTGNIAGKLIGVVGNGTVNNGPLTGNVRSNHSEFYWDGEFVLPSETIAMIDAWGTGRIVVTREWVEAEIAATTPSLQEVTDVGNTTTLNIGALSFNTVYVGIKNTSSYFIGNSSAMASYTGNNSIGIGNNALQFGSTSSNVAIGHFALYNTTNGGFSVGIGNEAGRDGNGTTMTAVGYRALGYAIGDNLVGIGANSARYSIGDAITGVGSSALYQNVKIDAVGIGVNAGYYNQGTSSTFLGRETGTSFKDDVANLKTVAVAATDVDPGLERVTITAHGFGAINDYVNLRYTTTGTAIGGLTHNGIYPVQIIDANTFQFVNRFINSTGTDTHTFTPQFAYDNVTVLGAYAEPTKSNQVVLGDLAVTEVKATNANYVGATFNDLELFAQIAVDVDNIGIGTNALASNTGTNTIAIGTQAGQSNTGNSLVAVGQYAGTSNTGLSCVAVGYNALAFNTGIFAVGIGWQSGYFNTGGSCTFVGLASGENNKAGSVTAIGTNSGRYNPSTGSNGTFVGDSSGRYNRSSKTSILGSNTGEFNLATQLTAIGYFAGQYNKGDKNTFLGAYDVGLFIDDTANAKNVADATTDINVGLQQITITSHGFGSTSTYVNLRYTTTGTPIGGLNNNNVYQFLIVDANTIQSINGFLTSNGTDTHTFTPQFVYSNVTTVGYNAQPTKSNQVVLGDLSVTEVKATNANAVVSSVNDLKLFAQVAVDADNIGIGTSALGSNTGLNAIAIGTSALQNNNDNDTIGIGIEAGQNNTGNSLTALGYQAAKANTGNALTAIGYQAGQNNGLGSNCVFVGHQAGTSATGNVTGMIGIGSGALQSNTSTIFPSTSVGYNSLRTVTGNGNTALGYNAGQNFGAGTRSILVGDTVMGQSGTYSTSNVAIGWFAAAGASYNSASGHNILIGASTASNLIGSYNLIMGTSSGDNADLDANVSLGYFSSRSLKADNTISIGAYAREFAGNSSNSVAVGFEADRYGDATTNTSIGYRANDTFKDDSGSAQNVAVAATDVVPGTDRITITGHGFGTVGTRVGLRYSTTGTPIGGLTPGTVYLFDIIDVNTIETATQNITSTGTDTHTFTPQFIYVNATAIGANSESTASNQVMLGDTAVTEVSAINANYVGATFNGAYINRTINSLRVWVSDESGTSTGTFSTAFGDQALENSTGSSNVAFGGQALENNSTYTFNTALGFRAGWNIAGSSNTLVGYNAAASGALVTNNTAIGGLAGRYAAGSNNVLVGQSSGLNAYCENSVLIGGTSGEYGHGNSNVFIGTFVGRYNQKDNNTAIGAGAFQDFIDDVANLKNVADAATDVDTGLNRITITAHGFGATNAEVNLRYSTTGTPITPLGDGLIYPFTIIDANTIEILGAIDITAVGTNTHTFTPQVEYTNVTVLGAGAEPTKSNQVMLGSSSVTEVVMGNGEVLNNIKKVKVSLTATNVNNIGTTPITAIAAPASGFVINVISAFANLTYGSVAFDNNTLDLETSGAGGTLFTWSSFLDSTANNLKTADRTAASDNDLISATAVVLAGTDSVATGDSTVDVYITYEIVEL